MSVKGLDGNGALPRSSSTMQFADALNVSSFKNAGEIGRFEARTGDTPAAIKFAVDLFKSTGNADAKDLAQKLYALMPSGPVKKEALHDIRALSA